MRSNTNLVIDFLGLPGSGKTTLSKRLSKQLESSNIPHFNTAFDTLTEKKSGRILYKSFIFLKEALLHPTRFIKHTGLIVRTRQRNIKDLAKVLINWFYIVHLLGKAQKMDRYVMLDQGLFQAIWSINLSAKQPVNTREMLDKIQLPDVVIVVNANEENIKNRLKKREFKYDRLVSGGFGENGATYQHAQRVLHKILGDLSNMTIPVIIVNNNSDEELEASVNQLKHILKGIE